MSDSNDNEDSENGLLDISDTIDLRNIEYSREDTIAAFHGYYNFLKTMYLDEGSIVEPPEEGWPEITSESMQPLRKTDEVVALLRHLPYIKVTSDSPNTHTLGRGSFANWTFYAQRVSQGHVEGTKVMTEEWELVPSHVIGLANSKDKILLDTHLGVIYFVECPHAIRFNPNLPFKPIRDDPHDYSPECEAEWRGWGAAWGVRDFFEVMKWLFRELQYVPVSRHIVEEIWEDDHDHDTPGARTMAQGIFRQHGWPEMEMYRKDECLDAVERAIEERYPNCFYN